MSIYPEVISESRKEERNEGGALERGIVRCGDYKKGNMKNGIGPLTREGNREWKGAINRMTENP